MKKFSAVVIYSLAVLGLMGCGGSGSNSTVLQGVVETAPGLSTSLAIQVENTGEDYSKSAEVDDGEFRLTKVPEGLSSITVKPSSSSSKSLQFSIEIEDGETSELELAVLTWDPIPVGEVRTREGGENSFSEKRPLGPSGITRTVESDGDRTFETIDGLVVTRKSDGSVDVDDSQYTGSDEEEDDS